MGGGFNLDLEAKGFADRLSGTLTKTVCTGVRISAVTYREPVVGAVLGRGITKSQLVGQSIPVNVPRGKPRVYLDMSYRLRADDECRYLAVASSFVGLFADPDLEQPLLHYDYEREKDEYPEAHIQIDAGSESWSRVLGDDRPLTKIHLPVGGRRFRPCLEDFIEMLIVERIAEGNPGYNKEIQKGRDWFHALQLKAAIRRDPTTALDALEALRNEGRLVGDCTLRIPDP